MIIEGAVILVTILFIFRTYNKGENAFCKSKKKLNGRTALVTGGTSGIGLEVAKDLARRGARVIIACPFNDEGENAKKLIIQKTGNTNVVFKLLDLGSFKSVRHFADDILQAEDKLDILINNAGIGCSIVGKKKLTEDGLINLMQINYYGHYLLTILLLPLLKRSAPSRIINTSSILHRLGNINIGRMNDTIQFQAYANSKLCLILFTNELAKRLKSFNVTVNVLEPGVVGGTGIWNSVSIAYIVSLLARFFFKNPFEGAQTTIHLAVDDDLAHVSGELYVNCKPAKAASQARSSEKYAKLLWGHSVEVCKLSDEELCNFSNN